jgi:hypothetical protein
MVWILVWKYIFEPFIHILQHFVLQLSRSTNFCFYVQLPFYWTISQALVSFKKYMPPPLPYFKVNIYSFLLPQFASIFFAYLWSFRWPNYIVTLPRYFSFRLPHLNITPRPPSDELDKNSQRTWLSENLSHWNGYSHFRSGLNWWFKNQMSVIWSWTYFYNLHWNNYLYFKGLLYIWEEMIMWHCYTWPV